MADVALEQKDTRLALWLSDPVAGLGATGLLPPSTTSQIGEIAARRHGLALVRGRMIGLVLPTDSAPLRDAAADTARGLAWSLGLPRRLGEQDSGVRMMTRDNDGGRPQDFEAVMEDLVTEGASIIIAGLDPTSAARAVRWADVSGVTVLALTPPAEGTKVRKNAFVFGEAQAVVAKELFAAIESRGHTNVAPILGDAEAPLASDVVATASGSLKVFQAAPCELFSTRSQDARYPFATWKKEGISSWLVLGSEACGHDILRELGDRPGHLLAFGLEACSLTDAHSAQVLCVGAGKFPLQATKRGRRGLATEELTPDPQLAEYRERLGSLPTWEAALGRDAGALARYAVQTLPLDETSDLAEVAKRRELVRSRLQSARMPLWTTEAQGFTSGPVIERKLRVVERAAGK